MDVSTLFLADEDQPDGVIVVSVGVDESTRQFGMRIQKSLSIDNDDASRMIDNTVTMLADFMVLTRSQQRSVIESCKNMRQLDGADQRPALTLINTKE